MNWNKLLTAAIAGAVAAAATDIAAFRSWKSFDDAVRYDWGLAAWRWFQGAIVGVLTVAVSDGGAQP